MFPGVIVVENAMPYRDLNLGPLDLEVNMEATLLSLFVNSNKF